jgi:hypothetical protein
MVSLARSPTLILSEEKENHICLVNNTRRETDRRTGKQNPTTTKKMRVTYCENTLVPTSNYVAHTDVELKKEKKKKERKKEREGEEYEKERTP